MSAPMNGDPRMTDKWCDHVCPECKTGKHKSCNGLAWCDFHDRETACACLDCEWGRTE